MLSELYQSLLETDIEGQLAVTNYEYSQQLQILTDDLSERIMKVLGMGSKLAMPENFYTIFRNLSFDTSDEYVKQIDLNYRGDGIKARHIPAIVKYIQDNYDKNRQKYAVSYSHIWGYEEPECGVELAACFDMAKELYSYRELSQIIISTHSPAFYLLGEENDANRFFSYKSENGNSKYSSNSCLNDINENIGLLGLIAPYVENINNMYTEQFKKLQEAEAQLRDLKNKIVIIPEGKTDVKHLKTAFSQLYESDDSLVNSLTFYEFDERETLGEDLKTILNRLSHIEIESVVIGLYDRDKLGSGNENTSYECLGKNVYKAYLPLPKSRKLKNQEKICIEHYYRDDEIKILTPSGRLYMGDDFDELGKSKDDNFFIEGWRKNLDSRKPYQIVDSSTKHLSMLSKEARCISKNEFAEYVSENPEKFDFSNFRLIYDLILEIKKKEN